MVISRTIYNIKLKEGNYIDGVYIRHFGDKLCFLKVREATKKETDFHTMKRADAKKKYNLSKKSIRKAISKQEFVKGRGQIPNLIIEI